MREWYELRREKQSFCKSCETYKEQLAIANFERKQLLEKLLYVPEPTGPITQPEQPKPIIPKIVPWKIQRQQLEAEDRARAAVMRKQAEEEEHAKAISAKIAASGGIQVPPAQHMETSSEISISQLEKELGVE